MSVANQTNYPDWTQDQWEKVTTVVKQEALRARVTEGVIPLWGGISPTAVALPSLRVGDVPNPVYAPMRSANRLYVDSDPTIYLATISVQIPFAYHDVADPDLSSVLSAFRRAAVIVARIEDALVFNGQPFANVAPLPTWAGGWLAGIPDVFFVSGGDAQAGLVPTGAAPYAAPPPANVPPRIPILFGAPVGGPGAGAARVAAMTAWGLAMVPAIHGAIGALEGTGKSGPYACFLSPDAYEAAHTPNGGNLVLPRDRFVDALGGNYIRRTNSIPNGYGIIVALGGQPVEIAVASDISVRYLQQTAEPRFLFRVAERIALRVKEWDAIAVLQPPPPPP